MDNKLAKSFTNEQEFLDIDLVITGGSLSDAFINTSDASYVEDEDQCE